MGHSCPIVNLLDSFEPINQIEASRLGTLIATSQNVSKLLLILSILIYCSGVFAEKSGPETGGGGNAVFAEGEFRLLDLFNVRSIETALSLTKSNHPELAAISPYPHPVEVQTLALKILANWQIQMSAYPLKNAELVEGSHVNFKLLSDQVQMSDYYAPQYLPEKYLLYQAAYYRKNDHIVSISHILWNRFDPTSKLGLLLHENLRHLQIGLDNSFTDEQLQKSTLVLLICPVANAANLSQSKLFQLPAQKLDQLISDCSSRL